jgi:hypothetical protein
MKKIALLSLVVISLMLSNCGNAVKKSVPNSGSESVDTGNVKISFREYEHNFGKVTEGEKVGYVFTFENQGTASLVIASATASCGCTVTKYNSKPIQPGEQGDLEVIFNTSGRNGIQTKTVTVKSNASTPVVLLKITAEVVTNN